jgi:hypothetical protein
MYTQAINSLQKMTNSKIPWRGQGVTHLSTRAKQREEMNAQPMVYISNPLQVNTLVDFPSI